MKSGSKVFSTLVCTLLAASALLFPVSCGKKQDAAATGKSAAASGKSAGKSGAPAANVFAVNTITAEKGSISDYLTLSGDIVAASTVDTFSDTAGKITRVYVYIGEYVRKGAPIASVDPSKPGMTYVQHIVQAPISGSISALPAEVGMTITTATSLASITGSGALEIRLYVPERYISKIDNGQDCQITLDAYPGETFKGKIYEISPTIDTISRTEQIKVNVDNTSSKLKAGLFAKVKIITQVKDNIIKIPSDSIVTRNEKSVVFVVDSDPKNPNTLIAKQEEVSVGINIDGYAEITSGVNVGDEIVEKGVTLLSDGAQINIQNTQSSQTAASQTTTSQTTVNETANSQTAGSQTTASQTTASQTAAIETTASQTTVSETADSQPANSQSANSQSANSQSANSQSANSQSKEGQ